MAKNFGTGLICGWVNIRSNSPYKFKYLHNWLDIIGIFGCRYFFCGWVKIRSNSPYNISRYQSLKLEYNQFDRINQENQKYCSGCYQPIKLHNKIYDYRVDIIDKFWLRHISGLVKIRSNSPYKISSY